MKFTAIAIDDEAYALKDLSHELGRLDDLNIKGTFLSASEAFDFLRENGPVNLVFCDIEMPTQSGLKAARRLSSYADYLIFTTGHDHYALDAYQVGADAYLMKPISIDDVRSKIDKLKELFKSSGRADDAFGKIFVRDGSKKKDYALYIRDIIAMHCNGNYVNIITANREYTHHITMEKLEKNLRYTGLFFRVSQSTIVAKEAIEEVYGNTLYLTKGLKYTIGKTYQQKFQAFYREYFLNNRCFG